MKKTLLWGAIASLFFASCSKNELVEAVESSCDFVAQLTDVSRTELDGTAVIWNAEDELTIFTKTEHNRHYKVKTLSDDGRTATFGFVNYTGTSNGTISANYAVYPYDAQATLNGDVISTVIASEQQYNAEKVDLSYALMAAKSENNSFAFVNAGALMRFNVSKSELIPDSYTLNSIKLSSAANNIAGDVTIDLSAESRAIVASTGTKEITLTAINQQITTEAKAFYVALPAVSFADKDLTVTFTFADGEKSFALPAFDLLQGSIKTIAYQINDADDFTGTTPDSGEDFEGETPGEEPVPANNEIWYTNGSTTEATTPCKTDVFGANIVSNTYDTEKGCWVIKFDGEVTKIGDSAFSSCRDLTGITIPEGVKLIGKEAFYNNNLKTVTIPESVTSIGERAFNVNEMLTSFNGKFASPDGRCLIINGTLHAIAPSGLTTYKIPDGVTAIHSYVFNLVNIDYIKLPNSLLTIEEYAFFNCPSLSTIELGVNTKTIKKSAFLGCSALKKVIIPAAKTWGEISFEDNNANPCRNGASLYINEQIVSSLDVFNEIDKISNFAFCGCSSLINIRIPENIRKIGELVFYNCLSLESVIVSHEVQEIGNDTFFYCPSLKTIFIQSIEPPIGSRRMFDNQGNNGCNCTIYVPTSSVDAYKTAEYWSEYADKIVGYDF